MKLVLKLGAVFVILVIALGIAVFTWIDHIAKAGVERGATFALGVDTTVDDMDVGVIGGSVDMTALNVANPPGYQSDHFLHLGDGRVAVSLRSLRSPEVVVPELTLNSVRMNLEHRKGEANYNAILDNLKRFESKGPPPEQKKEGKKFVIERVAIRDVQVDVELLPVGGDLTRVPVKIEQIELNGVGSDSDNGVLMAELTNILIQAILKAVVEKAGNVLPSDIAAELNMGLAQLDALGKAAEIMIGEVTATIDGVTKRAGEFGAKAVEDLTQQGEQIGDDLKKAGDDLKKTGDKIGGDLEDAGKKIGEGLGGLLGGGKDDAEGKEEDN